MTVLKIIGGVVVFIGVLGGVGWLGLRADAPRFATYPESNKDLGSVDLPSDLPDPVARYAQAVYGDQIPVVESAVLIGRVDMNMNGLHFPARFKIYHQAGQDYYHFIEVTWFGLPIMRVNERYQNGVGTMDVPGSLIKDDPKINSAANQGLWAESLAWIPAVVFTDPQVQWEAIDATTAKMILPNAVEEEMFIVTFDPDSGLITGLTTQRYRDANNENRHQWTSRILKWGEVNGFTVPLESELQWDDDAPWATWHMEQVIYNVDVSQRINQFGGKFED